ncbi:helix-turn-helix domain-containing protein [Leptospira sp. GIMC2001]|uniref:helix-turn-helix domain-containing protein n=1 Tax=Leptospira sp. GIMC2001 TaxID=1513297 RepID=UPI00234B49A0|nr:AraC family transcriptional regulator [Leptospira sp. GIMC2001]WCL48326.1 AraC family transcriptional regulator [Leptospira sp. GIMC2001]
MILIHEILLKGSFFGYTDDWIMIQDIHQSRKEIMHILWNRSHETKEFFCDDKWISLPANSLATLNSLYHIRMDERSNGIVSFFFNRDFYCIRDHDHEVSCNGILFFGAQEIPIVSIPKSKEQMFDALWSVFIEELKIDDPIQNEMLLALLKRFIIQITRIVKENKNLNSLDSVNLDKIRRYHMLVDEFFRTKKKVSDYAVLLGIAPNSLSNLMAESNQISPLSVIHNRIILEVKRLLLHSNKSLTEITEELNFEDSAQLSKLFKKKTNFSPMEFKKQFMNPINFTAKGNIDKKKGNSDIYRLIKAE